MTDLHRHYTGRLRRSYHGVFVVAEWYHSQEWSVSIPYGKVAPDEASMFTHADNGDLFIEKDGVRLSINVHHLNTQFTGRDDWPYKDIFVGHASALDRRTDDYYVSLSKDEGCITIVSARTKPAWTKRTVPTPGAPGQAFQTNYCCPMKHVGFRRLKEQG